MILPERDEAGGTFGYHLKASTPDELDLIRWRRACELREVDEDAARAAAEHMDAIIARIAPGYVALPPSPYREIDPPYTSSMDADDEDAADRADARARWRGE